MYVRTNVSTHVLLVDTGNSYLGLCEMINRKTNGKDGVYFTYTAENPIAFNPFYTDDGLFDIEKKESIKTLILTLWKRDNEPPTRSEEVALSNAVSLYIEKLNSDNIVPSFNTFYDFVGGEYREILAAKQVREKDFDVANFLNVLEPYYKGGEYDYLLNSDKQLDLLNKRFIVFELDNIKDHKILFPIVTIIIMLGQDGKESPLQEEKSAFAGNGIALNTIKSSNANRYFGAPRSSSIQNSVSAYRDINRTLGGFYDNPRQDPEKERLAKELEETKAKLAENENHKNNVDEQVALMEKSYQMAAKYMPQMQGQGQTAAGVNGQLSSRNSSGKLPVVPVSHAIAIFF